MATLLVGQYDKKKYKTTFFSAKQLRENAELASRWNMYEMSPALFNFISEQVKDEEITPLIKYDELTTYIGEYATRNGLCSSTGDVSLDETLANLVGSKVGTKMSLHVMMSQRISNHLTFGEESKRNRVEAFKVQALKVDVRTIDGVVCLVGMTPEFDKILFDIHTQKHIGWKLFKNSKTEWLEEPQDWSVGGLILNNEDEYWDAIGEDDEDDYDDEEDD